MTFKCQRWLILLLQTEDQCLRFSIVQTKHQDKKATWGRKGLLDLHFHIAVHDWRKSGYELKQGSGGRSWHRGHGRVLLTDLFHMPCSTYFLIESRTTRPGMELPTNDWSLHHLSLNGKMPYSWITWKHFLSWGSFLSDNSSLCQVDTQ